MKSLMLIVLLIALVGCAQDKEDLQLALGKEVSLSEDAYGTYTVDSIETCYYEKKISGDYGFWQCLYYKDDNQIGIIRLYYGSFEIFYDTSSNKKMWVKTYVGRTIHTTKQDELHVRSINDLVKVIR